MVTQCHQLNLQTNLQISSKIKYSKSKNSFTNKTSKIFTIENAQNLLAFNHLKKSEIFSINNNLNPNTCIMYPYSTKCLLKFKNTILDTINVIANQSLTKVTFLEHWKLASIRPLIKGQNLETKFMKCRCISKLSFLSQIIKRWLKHSYRTFSMTNLSYQNIKVLIDNLFCGNCAVKHYWQH